MAILESSQKVEYRKMKFAASLKGVDLDGASQAKEKTFSDIVREAEIKEGLESEGISNTNLEEFGLTIEESD